MKQALIFLSLGCLLSCSKNPDNNLYRYEVSGNASSYDITYHTKDGSTEQKSAVSPGWSYEFKDADTERFVYISAQNNDSVGSVSVKIKYEGKIIKQAYSDGAYVIATASR